MVEAELEQLIGPAFESLAVSIEVTGDDPRQIALTAFRVGAGELSLERTVELRPADCPLGHTVIARSVQRGLEALPGWSWGRPPERRWWSGRAGIAVGTGPAIPSATLELGWSTGLPGPLRLPIHARGGASTFTAVGSGQAQIFEGLVGTGLSAEVGSGWLWPHVLVEGGVGWVRGRNFESNTTTRAPRMDVRAGLDLGLTESVGLALDAVAQVVRAELVEQGTRATVTESSARLEIALALRLPSR